MTNSTKSFVRLHCRTEKTEVYLRAERRKMKELNIGTVLAAHRREKGVTQEEVAAFVGVSKASVSKWENGVSQTKGY